MSGKVRAWFDLIRLPNVVTATADVTAGFLLAGGTIKQAGNGLMLCLASAFLYAGGVVLNDVWDADVDHRERPHRPIPSGRITRASAFRSSIAFLIAGVGLSLWTSATAGTTALLLVLTIILYDGVLKHTGFAPGLMGLCRALNVILGAAGQSEWVVSSHSPVLAAALSMWLFVTFLTVYARGEARREPSKPRQRAALAVGAGFATVAGLNLLSATVHRFFLVPALFTAGWFALVGWRAAGSGEPVHVQVAVKTFVLGIVLLDALAVWAIRGPALALPVLGILLLSWLLSLIYRVT